MRGQIDRPAKAFDRFITPTIIQQAMATRRQEAGEFLTCRQTPAVHAVLPVEVRQFAGPCLVERIGVHPKSQTRPFDVKTLTRRTLSVNVIPAAVQVVFRFDQMHRESQATADGGIKYRQRGAGSASTVKNTVDK